MSLQERIRDAARVGNQDVLTQLEVDRQRKDDMLAAEIQMRGETVALSRQRQLVKKLRSIGVVGMIEEATGTNFPRIGEDVDNSSSPWTIAFNGPTPLPSGEWNIDVNLDIERVVDVGPNRGRRWLIEVGYTQMGELTIIGQEPTYRGVITRRSTKITELIQDALVKAFANPRIY